MDKDSKFTTGHLGAGSSQDSTNPVASIEELERLREEREKLVERFKLEGGYDFTGIFDDEGHPAYVHKDNKEWYIKLDGTELSSWRYDRAGIFSEGRAHVQIGPNHWFIKEDGSDLSNQTYDYAYGFKHGLAAVKRDNKWWFVKLDGTDLSEERYDQIASIMEDRVRVWQGDESWYISTKTGKKIPGTEGGKY